MSKTRATVVIGRDARKLQFLKITFVLHRNGTGHFVTAETATKESTWDTHTTSTVPIVDS